MKSPYSVNIESFRPGTVVDVRYGNNRKYVVEKYELTESATVLMRLPGIPVLADQMVSVVELRMLKVSDECEVDWAIGASSHDSFLVHGHAYTLVRVSLNDFGCSLQLVRSAWKDEAGD